LTIVCIKNHGNLQEHFLSILYFSLYSLINLFAFLYSLLAKNVSREKAYIKKNISFYLIFLCGISSSLYISLVLGQYYNGVLSLFLIFIIPYLRFIFPQSFLELQLLLDLYRCFHISTQTLE